MSQSKIIQIFKLNEKTLTELVREKKLELPKDVIQRIEEELSFIGYEVKHSSGVLMGVPESFAVSGDPRMNFKTDFYKITEEMRLPYSSGEFYL